MPICPAAAPTKNFIYNQKENKNMNKYQWIILGTVFIITSISFFIASIVTQNVILGWVLYGAFGMAFFALAIASWTMYVVEYETLQNQKSSRKRQ
jgi:protein-S-isoprenylcysteine O-methyltransferase Ste14